MNWKEFFKPTKEKIITLVVLSILTLILPLPVNLPSLFWGSGGGTQSAPFILVYALMAFLGNSDRGWFVASLLFFLMILLHLSIVYLITCLIFGIYNKFKK